MEKALMKDNMQKKIPTSSLMIREKAVHIFDSLKKQASAIDKIDNFSGSTKWFQKFKKRYSSWNLKLKDETASADKFATEEFLS